jgi:hypothetical protein
MRKYLFLALAVSGLVGCQSIQGISGLGAQAKTRIGQMLYRTPKRAVAADVYLSTVANGDYALTMTKGGVTILQIQVRDTTLTAAGLLAGTGFSGNIQRLPAILRPWGELRGVIPHFEGNENQAEDAGRWRATFERNNSNLTRAEVQFARGTTMIFSFGR